MSHLRERHFPGRSFHAPAIAILVIAHAAVRAGFAAPPEELKASPAEVEAAQQLLREALQSRLDVRSGAVQIDGRRGAVRNQENHLSYEGPVTARCLFDRQHDAYVYHSSEPFVYHVFAPGDQRAPRPNQRKAQQVKYWSCRTPEYYAQFSQLASNTISNLTVLPLHADSRDTTPSMARRSLDVLAFGVQDYWTFEKKQQAPEVYQALLDMEVQSFAVEGNLARVDLRDETSACKITFDLELKAPVQFEWQSLVDPSRFVSSTTWRKIEGVAVPVKHRAQLIYPDVATETWEADLEWSRINDAYDPGEFEYERFTGLPRNIVNVYDHRGSEVRYIGKWVSDGVVKLDAKLLR